MTADSEARLEGDDALLTQAAAGIEALNAKYGASAHGRFFLFHRPRLFNAQEGWLHHRGGQRAELPIRFAADLPDGRYDLTLNVYADSDYRGRPYSRFLVDGRPFGTRSAALKGPEDVDAGPVAIKGGVCAFTLSPLDEEAGVILYHVALRRPVGDRTLELYAMRTRLADAIETLQTALAAAGH